MGSGLNVRQLLYGLIVLPLLSTVVTAESAETIEEIDTTHYFRIPLVPGILSAAVVVVFIVVAVVLFRRNNCFKKNENDAANTTTPDVAI